LRPMNSPEGVITTRDYYGRKEIKRSDWDKMLRDYYSERGWDPETGKPTPILLEELDLDWLLDLDDRCRRKTNET
ncbi:MAG: hypothetical protein JXA42_20230, partial [Anaerolineales bacterium]|nr:hypothetical protein [Anaerolineales bacterium]